MNLNIVFYFVREYGNLDPLINLVGTFFVGTNVFIYIHIFRLKWDRPPALIFIPWLIVTVYVLFMWASHLANESLMANVVFDIYRIGSGILGIYIYKTFDPMLENLRIQRLIRIWIIIGVVLCLLGLSNLITITIFQLDRSSVFLDLSLSLNNIANNILSTLVPLFVIITAIFYPEIVLLSKTQFYRARNLYEIVRGRSLDKNSEQLNPLNQKQMVMNYMSQVLKEHPEIV